MSRPTLKMDAAVQVNNDIAFWRMFLKPLGLILTSFTFQDSCMAIAPKTGATVSFTKDVVNAILAARRENNAFVVETCAKVADTYSDALNAPDEKTVYASLTATLIAKEIRHVVVI